MVKKKPKRIRRDTRNDANNCTGNIQRAIPLEKRIEAAEKLGPNWACIMSGLGDQ